MTMSKETRDKAIAAQTMPNPFVEKMKVAKHARYINVDLVNNAPSYVRRLLWYPFGYRQPREIPSRITVTGVDMVKDKHVLDRVLTDMTRYICRTGMNNLRIERMVGFNQDTMDVRIVVDSRGWTGK